MLELVNYHLASHYTILSDTFVTAFYGIYNPERRELTYACAGHNPPRLKHCDDGTLSSLNEVSGFPLGIFAEGKYNERVQPLRPGDQVVFYTDGITEARNPEGDMFGTERLDEALELCPLFADALLQAVLDRLEQFTTGRPADDDRTLLVAKIS
jgi:sigma-B regulation protein RsbU (phosphoserine phosphatase)